MELLNTMSRFLALRQNACKSHTEIMQLQKQQLDQLLLYAYDHSVYYRQRFLENGISREQIGTLPLNRYPTLDKAALMANFDQLVTTSDLTQAGLRTFDETSENEGKLYLDRYHVVHSSGSTGTPHYFVYDEEAWQEMLCGILRGALWGMTLPELAGFLLSRPRILYVAATEGRYGGAMAVGDGVDGVGAKQMVLDINTPLNEWIGRIKTFQPNMIIGYPTAIQVIAEMAERGEIHPKLKRVVCCGEPLPRGMRRFLEQALHTEVINFYGASESLALGVEGAGSSDMILFDDLNVIEVMNGEMYVTCLYNFAQPLIRYHLTDRLTLKPDSKGAFSCAEILLSRSEDVLWFEDAAHPRDFLHPLAVEGFCLDGLTDYQFVQRAANSFTMLAVAERSQQSRIRQELTRRLYMILKEKQMDWVDFSIEFSDKIQPDAHTEKNA